MTRCKLETQTTADRLARAAEDREHPGRRVTATGPTSFTVTGVPPEQDAAFRNALTEVDVNYDRIVRRGGSYTFTLKPNIVVQLREDTVNQALQTIERRVNELGVAEPIVARHSAADQILVQLPGVTDVDRAKEIIRSTAQLELKQVEQGPFSDENAARAGLRRQRAARHGDSSGHDRSRPGPAGQHRLLRGAPRARRHRPRPAQRAADARREQPSRRQLLAQPGRARASSAPSRRPTSAASSASCSTTACSRRR